jgi:hypothetical protein
MTWLLVAQLDDFQVLGEDDKYWVYQESVNAAVEEPCAAMHAAGEAIPLPPLSAEDAASIRRFVEVARRIPAAIDRVDDADDGARQWRDDWVHVIDAVESYADDLEPDGRATFVSPRDEDGEPTTLRMISVSDVPCELPTTILLLDQKASG